MFIPGVVVDSVRLAARVVVHTFDGFQARSASRDGFAASLFQLRSVGDCWAAFVRSLLFRL